MQHLLPAVLKLLYQHDEKTLFNPDFFEERKAESLGMTFVQVKPIAGFAKDAVDLGYHVGTRGNGVDAPVWPKDLRVEVVREEN